MSNSEVLKMLPLRLSQRRAKALSTLFSHCSEFLTTLNQKVKLNYFKGKK